MMGADGPDFLSQDPYQQYQYTLDVAPPISEMDYDDEIPPPPNVLRRQSTYQTSPRTFEERELEADVEERHEDIRPRRTTQEDEWDFSELSKDGVDVQAFIRKNLSGADEEEKARFIAALQKHKQTNAKEVRTQVAACKLTNSSRRQCSRSVSSKSDAEPFQLTYSYAEFVSISKEISTLENDMFELKELLTEWKGVPQLMGMEDTLAPTLDKDGNGERSEHQRTDTQLSGIASGDTHLETCSSYTSSKSLTCGLLWRARKSTFPSYLVVTSYTRHTPSLSSTRRHTRQSKTSLCSC